MRPKETLIEELLERADLVLVDEVKAHDEQSREVCVRFVVYGNGPRDLMRELREWTGSKATKRTKKA